MPYGHVRDTNFVQAAELWAVSERFIIKYGVFKGKHIKQG